mmetsp:Transcript_9470/g.23550  ORF Transcript_9470/g.23550 Transcript_9470/m.23550 type:complete len:231 (-) Transcript_9470:542-1234(-)
MRFAPAPTCEKRAARAFSSSSTGRFSCSWRRRSRRCFSRLRSASSAAFASAIRACSAAAARTACSASAFAFSISAAIAASCSARLRSASLASIFANSISCRLRSSSCCFRTFSSAARRACSSASFRARSSASFLRRAFRASAQTWYSRRALIVRKRCCCTIAAFFFSRNFFRVDQPNTCAPISLAAPFFLFDWAIFSIRSGTTTLTSIEARSSRKLPHPAFRNSLETPSA